MRRCAGIKIPLRGTWWLGRDTSGLERGVEGSGVEAVGLPVRRWLLMMTDSHRLLGLERRLGSQNARARCAEGHGPGLHHALPRVIARGPWHGLGLVVGVVAARVAAAAVASSTAAPPIVAVATVVGSGIVVARRVGVGGAIG